jgi:hypothetical protein
MEQDTPEQKNAHLIYLPIPEAFDADEDSPEYMTSVVADPIEHFIHHPERTLSEYGWTKKELQKVNWPAIKIMWQNMLKHIAQHGDITGVTIGKEGWGDEGEQGVEFVPFDFELPTEAQVYDPTRVSEPELVKKDYLWFRNDLISKVGKYNNDDPKFGLPEDLYSQV